MSRSIDPMAQHKAGCGLSRRTPRPHRFDESAAGYSLAGCSPAEPASASPANLIMPPLGWIRYAFSVNCNPSLISWPRRRGPVQGAPTFQPARPAVSPRAARREVGWGGSVPDLGEWRGRDKSRASLRRVAEVASKATAALVPRSGEAAAPTSPRTASAAAPVRHPYQLPTLDTCRRRLKQCPNPRHRGLPSAALNGRPGAGTTHAALFVASGCRRAWGAGFR